MDQQQQQQSISEQVAYLQGVAEGIRVENNPENRLLRGMVGVLASMASDLEEIQDYVSQIDEDLLLMDEENGGRRGPYVEGKCPQCGEEVRFAENYLVMEGVEVACPHCGGIVFAVAQDSSPQEKSSQAARFTSQQ